MTYLYLLSLLTLVAYIGYALKVCGLPASLSSLCRALSCCSRKSGCSGWKWRCLRVLILDCWLKCYWINYEFEF